MSEDIEEIRKAKAQKARELLGALDSDNEEIRQQATEVLPWAYRLNNETQFIEILQQGNMVAITQDPRFAELLTHHGNRMILVLESGMLKDEEI